MRAKGPACGALAGGVQIAAPQGWREAARPRPRRGAVGERPASRQPRLGRRRRRGAGGGYAGRRGRRQSLASKASAGGVAGRQGWPERRRPGRRGGRPHSPHRVGAGPPRSTYAATGEGEEQRKARCKRPRRGLALRCGGVPPSNGGGQLDRAGLARPWPPHYPGTAQRAGPGRAATSRPGRAGVAARRPLGAGGTAQRAGREPPPPP